MATNSRPIMSMDLIDGFRSTFENCDIMYLRPSGNEPEFRCYAESLEELSAIKLCQNCLIALLRTQGIACWVLIKLQSNQPAQHTS